MKLILVALLLVATGWVGCQLPPASPARLSPSVPLAVAPVAPTPIVAAATAPVRRARAMPVPPAPGVRAAAAPTEAVFSAAGGPMSRWAALTNRFPRLGTNGPTLLNLHPIQMLSDGTNCVVVWWRSYTNWTAQYSTDLANWITISKGTTLLTNAPVVVVEYSSGRIFDKKFYRLIPTP